MTHFQPLPTIICPDSPVEVIFPRIDLPHLPARPLQSRRTLHQAVALPHPFITHYGYYTNSHKVSLFSVLDKLNILIP